MKILKDYYALHINRNFKELLIIDYYTDHISTQENSLYILQAPKELPCLPVH